MDDPISALDVKVRKNIVNNVINGILKEKTKILVTHAIDFIHMADKIVMMDDGKIKAQGTYDQLLQNEDFKKLLEVNEINNQQEATGSSSSERSSEEATSSTDETVNKELPQLKKNKSNKKNKEEKKVRLTYPSKLSIKEKE